MTIAMKRGSDLRYLHSDHLGSNSVVTNADGTVHSSQEYCAYGGQRTVTQFGYQCNTTVNALPTDRTYTGQEQDTTGLMYFRARMYDPALGTFLSPDTIVPEPGVVFDYNRYMYVRGNNLKYNDPSGHCPVCFIVAAVLILGGSTAVGSSEGSYSDVPDNSNGKLAASLLVGDVNDIVTVATQRDYINQRDVPYFSGEWWSTAGLAALPILSGASVSTVRSGEDVVGLGQDLFAFGNKTAPRPPRIGTDIIPNASGMVGPSQLPFPQGASTFADISQAPLSGHYHSLPKGTVLPDGLGVASDGMDVIPMSPHPPSHHTLYPTKEMSSQQFQDLFSGLPWGYGGKK